MGYIDHIASLKEQMNYYMDRLDAGKHTSSDNGLILEIAGSCYEELKNQLDQLEPTEQAACNKILNDILQFQDGIGHTKAETDEKRVRAAYIDFSKDAEPFLFKDQWTMAFQEIFQIDLEQMRLEDAKINAMQELVDLEKKRYGSGNLSKELLTLLEAQHCEVIDNVVWHKPETEAGSIDAKREPLPAADIKDQTAKAYKATVYMKNTGGDKQKPKITYGDSPEEIISNLQRWNLGRTPEMQFSTCYVGKLDASSNQYEKYAKYDVKTGEDVTPIYLKLPSMNRKAFEETVASIKQDGARFNPSEKKFYITKRQMEEKFDKFVPYIPNHEIDRKGSVISKLEQNNRALSEARQRSDPAPRDVIRDER